ncbi:hypothetical protein IQ03_03896 [Gemmobacter caeni]|uniref:Uncharacterized protein n=1 Tax=Gemmobacter caeni TaxID=589035 RepID=A0A2T6B9E5_9RHOB|nr:hypothetical protein [Gemmobacter caeni]PTX52648.1 hypothetical protein C8N34_102466 [Gemmobacter caeni]TWI94897.1 hypothetical protein IQ03_03896 [Gemmobacter caeni]
MAKFQITLDVEVPDGATPGPEHLYAVLEGALDAAAKDPSELLAQIRQAEPGRDWVIRSETGPGLILTDQGTWFACTPETVPDTALHGADAGQMIALKEGQIWCRRDLISGEAVIADLHSDDRFIDLQVDIRPFLETATADEINELIAEDWAYAESADRVAYALEAAGDPAANRLFWYLGLNPRGIGNEQVGFGLRAEGGDALRWLSENRAEIISHLDIEEGPDGP